MIVFVVVFLVMFFVLQLLFVIYAASFERRMRQGRNVNSKSVKTCQDLMKVESSYY